MPSGRGKGEVKRRATQRRRSVRLPFDPETTTPEDGGRKQLAANFAARLDSPVVFLAYSLVVVLSYLLGSIPSGVLAGRMAGVDIRKEGSGNIGATNVFRILGKKAGTAVLFCDALKGWLAVSVIAELVALGFGPPTLSLEAAPGRQGLQLAAGVAAIVGHNFTCWLRFKGGKGVATSGGVLIAWLPLPFLVVLSVWILVFAISRYVSLASVVTAIALPFATWQLNGQPPLVIITSLLSAMAIYKHRSNIARLLNGTENRFGRKKGSDRDARGETGVPR